MPFDQVLPKFGAGKLHSGSKSGPKVTNHKQAVAIMLSEKKKAGQGKTEYKSSKTAGKREQRKPKPNPRGFASIPSSKGKSSSNAKRMNANYPYTGA